jgi:hypothetical protein
MAASETIDYRYQQFPELVKILKAHFPPTRPPSKGAPDVADSELPEAQSGRECVGCNAQWPKKGWPESASTLFCDPSPSHLAVNGECPPGLVAVSPEHSNSRIAGKCVVRGCEKRGWVNAQIVEVVEPLSPEDERTYHVRIGLTSGKSKKVAASYLTNVPASRGRRQIIRAHPTGQRCLSPQVATTTLSQETLSQMFGPNYEETMPSSLFKVNDGDMQPYCPNGGATAVDRETAISIEYLDFTGTRPSSND